MSRRTNIWCVLLTALSLCVVEDCALKLVELRVPGRAVLGRSVKLECHFALEDDSLYSVRWYKDGDEFFRYLPRDTPPVQTFQLPGVTVDLHNSSQNYVVLQSVNLSSSGRYRCEISGEAPAFQTVTEHGDLLVVSLPEEGPRITGGKPRYQPGDTVRVNCTSGSSYPAAQLSWFINGEPADRDLLHGPYVFTNGRDGLETSLLGLEFIVKARHFKRGDMKLKCLATIEAVYWRSNEESVQGDRTFQKAHARESAMSMYPISNHITNQNLPEWSRADRVQAAVSTGSMKKVSSVTNLITFEIILFILSKFWFFEVPTNFINYQRYLLQR